MIYAILQILTIRSCVNPLPLQVTDAEAPGYSREIARPMDLATALRRLDQPDGVAYKEQGGDLLAGFDADIEVMLANCVQYNGLRSDFGRVSSALS